MEQDSDKLFIGPVSPAVPGPLYQQIIDQLKREISEGRLSPGTALPSFRALAEDLMVSVITVKRAYEELEREGIIYRRQGLGTFVAEKGIDRTRDAKKEAAREMFRQGILEAAEAGLADNEIIELIKKELKHRRSANE
jgi:GntR family transcriptional regulator